MRGHRIIHKSIARRYYISSCLYHSFRYFLSVSCSNRGSNVLVFLVPWLYFSFYVLTHFLSLYGGFYCFGIFLVLIWFSVFNKFILVLGTLMPSRQPIINFKCAKFKKNIYNRLRFRCEHYNIAISASFTRNGTGIIFNSCLLFQVNYLFYLFIFDFDSLGLWLRRFRIKIFGNFKKMINSEELPWVGIFLE